MYGLNLVELVSMFGDYNFQLCWPCRLFLDATAKAPICLISTIH